MTERYTEDDVTACEAAMCLATDPDETLDDLEFNKACVRAVLSTFTSRQATRLQSLEAENARLRDALNDIQARVLSGYFVDAAHLGDIARNALKED